jgi:zinc protease
MLSSFRFVGAAAFAAMLWSAPSQAQMFNPETFTLKNGMQVVVVSNHRVPVVSHMVWYRVGSADEPPGKSGIAHVTEHLMFKGTKDIPAGEFSKIVARNGGRDNAFTSSDYTAYFQNVAVDRLELVMKMEADRMVNLTLDDENVRTERDVVREERRSRTDNNPSALLSERAEAMLYLNHPYRNPIIGWEAELKKLNTEDALSFYRRWYAPNNAVLLVAGDITAEKLKPLAEKYYGVIPAGKVPPRIRPEEPPQVGARRIELRDPRVRQPSWGRRFLAPSYHAGDKDRAYALQVLAEVIGGGSTSRLYRALVVEQGLAVGAGAWYEPMALDLSSFGVFATPRPGVPVEKVEAAMEAQLAEIVSGKAIDPGEVERAKTRLRASVVYARDSLHVGPRVLGEALTTGQTVEDVEDWPRRIGAVTVEQVVEAAKAVLREHQSVTSILLPEQSS